MMKVIVKMKVGVYFYKKLRSSLSAEIFIVFLLLFFFLFVPDTKISPWFFVLFFRFISKFF